MTRLTRDGSGALFFHGTIDVALDSPAGNNLGLWVVLIPVTGGLIVGLMAR